MAERYGLAQQLRVGDLSATLDAGALRWVCWRGVEVLRGIEVTVRDATWGTVTPSISAIRSRTSEGRMTVTLDAHFRSSEIDLEAHIEIELEATGRVRLALSGRALTTFLRNRVGIICLHPMDVAGRHAVFRHPDHEVAAGFPSAIDPHVVSTDVIGMTWQPRPGVRASLALEGDLWEIEDQRNWTDASFKTYPTPLRIPYPATVEAGTIIEQGATLTVAGRPRAPARQQADTATVERVIRGRLPRVGAELPGGDGVNDPAETAGLSSLGLRHVRAFVDLETDDAEAQLAAAVAAAGSLAVPLELDVAVESEAGTHQLADGLVGFDCVGIFAFDRSIGAGIDSTARAVNAVRTALESRGLAIPVGGGTRANFTELNRLPRPLLGLDAVTYAVNPQVHAFDEASIMETIPVLPLTVAQARSLTGSRPLSIVASLRPRFNPAAPRPQGEIARLDPNRADPRLTTAFAGAWAFGTIAALCRRGVSRITLGETAGPSGLVQASDGETWNARIAPMGSIVAALAGAPWRLLRTTAPETLTVLATEGSDGVSVLIANLEARHRRVDLRLPWSGTASIERLAPGSYADPSSAWGSPNREPVGRYGRLRMELEPWQVARIRGDAR